MWKRNKDDWKAEKRGYCLNCQKKKKLLYVLTFNEGFCKKCENSEMAKEELSYD